MAYGSDTTWRYDSETKTLYISGNGAMDNYTDQYSSPWYQASLAVEHFVVEQGVTSVGAYALSGFTTLQTVSLADSVTAIGAYAFSSCPALTELTLGENVKSIADVSFAFDGITEKANFVLHVQPGTYPLAYAYENYIAFDCDSVKTGTHSARVFRGGVHVYFPYTPKITTDYHIYSTGNEDTVGYLYDSAHNQLAYNDDESGTNFGYTYTLQQGTTYYIRTNILGVGNVGTYPLVIEPVSYHVSGSIYAMLSPDGAPSDILLSNATIDGEPCDGTFSFDITGGTKTVTIACDGVEKQVTFNADDDFDTVTLMMCDANRDGIVNGRDYVRMKQSNSPYLTLFNNFLHYQG